MGSELETNDGVNPYYYTLVECFYRNEWFWRVKETLRIYDETPEVYENNLQLIEKCVEFMDLYRYYLAHYRRWKYEYGEV